MFALKVLLLVLSVTIVFGKWIWVEEPNNGKYVIFEACCSKIKLLPYIMYIISSLRALVVRAGNNCRVSLHHQGTVDFVETIRWVVLTI